MSDQPAALSLEQVLTFLTEKYPDGASFAHGELEARLGEGTKVTSLADLGALSRAPQKLTFDLRGKKYVVEMRGMDGVEASKVDAIVDPLPPQKKVAGKGGVMTEQFDFHDPKYMAERDRVYKLKRTMIIATGLVGLNIPGENLDAKSAWLDTNFTPQVLELFKRQILSLTSNDLVIASFE